MIARVFGRHAREFGKALRAGAFERTAEGIYFPRQRALLHGHVKVETPRGVVHCANRILQFALTQINWGSLLTAGGTSPALSGMYIAPWANPVDTSLTWESDVMANVDAYAGDVTLLRKLGELGDAPEGYDEATRPAWTWVDQGNGLLDNSGSPAAFTMRTASTIQVRGFALCQGGSFPSTADVKRRGLPDFVYVNYQTVDLTNAFFPEILTNASGYAPTGTVINGSSGPWEDSYAAGRGINLDPAAHPGDPNQGPIDNGSLATVTQWYDPSGDDYFDTGLGNWVDPSGDSINGGGVGDPLIAVVSFPPESFVDMAAMNITWGLQLSAA